MFNYCILIRHEIRKEVYTNDYLVAWEIYRAMAAIYPRDTIIDLVDARTGEVVQSNSPDF